MSLGLQGGGSGGGTYTGTSPTNTTVGGLASGTAIAGMSFSDIIQAMTVSYLSPAFTSFSISGQSTLLEVGDTIPAGSPTFLWGTSNPSNINANSIAVRDTTTSTLLASGLANDGTEAIAIAGVNFTTVTTHSWSIEATNTNTILFSTSFSVSSSYKEFYGDSASAPTNSATTRALPSSRFVSAGTTFSFFTGTTNKIFTIAMPATKTLVSVFDATAGFDITGSFVLNTFNVNDFAGTPVAYNIYILTNAVPYGSTHQFNVTTT